MIDASTFASRHNAFWASYTPTSEHYIRRINLEYSNRWGVPATRLRGLSRAAFVAEYAFARFCVKIGGATKQDIDLLSLNDAKSRMTPLLDDPLILVDPLSEGEESQALYLERSLGSFFSEKNAPVVIRPVFRGCGYIDASEGDVICGSCLYEVKSVDRQFRSLDVRQLITYCALNYISSQFHIDSIGLFNPKRGLYFEESIEIVSHEISGQNSSKLFDAIIRAISSGDISR